MKCSRCQVNEAIFVEGLGNTECESCKKIHFVPKRGPEFTTESVKDQRRGYRKDILQPWHDGALSKEYLKEYGTQGVNASDQEIKNAKETYKGTPGYYNFDKSRGGKRD